MYEDTPKIGQKIRRNRKFPKKLAEIQKLPLFRDFYPKTQKISRLRQEFLGGLRSRGGGGGGLNGNQGDPLRKGEGGLKPPSPLRAPMLFTTKNFFPELPDQTQSDNLLNPKLFNLAIK